MGLRAHFGEILLGWWMLVTTAAGSLPAVDDRRTRLFRAFRCSGCEVYSAGNPGCMFHQDSGVVGVGCVPAGVHRDKRRHQQRMLGMLNHGVSRLMHLQFGAIPAEYALGP